LVTAYIPAPATRTWRRILVKSQNGPGHTIIDCQGTPAEPHRAFTLQENETQSFIIDGFTIQDGYGEIFNGSPSGGGIFIDAGSPIVKNCVFVDNSAVIGGAVYANESNAQFINCTFANNSASYGAAILSFGGSNITMENCILAFNLQGQPVSCFEFGTASAFCSDVYANAGGDWAGCLAGQDGTNGNISADPQFCHPGSGDYGLRDESPCASSNNSCAVRLGARGVGCSCFCGDHCDLNLDGDINPVDVVFMVNFVYKGLDGRGPLPECVGDNGDWNCDAQVNPVDVVYYVNFVYKSQGGGPCDPCAL
jgi:hypothetical protein